MRTKIFILVGLNLFLINCFAQQPTQEWVRRYTDTSAANWSNNGIKTDRMGNIYVLAESGTFGFIKYSPAGNFITIASYFPPGYLNGGGDYFDVTPNGDVYITGKISINFNSWIYTIKYNTNGVAQWGKLYIPDNSDASNDIKVDKNGNTFIIGTSLIGTQRFGLIIKYSPTGDTLWTRKFNNGQNTAGFVKMILDDSNNVCVTGLITNGGHFFLGKYSPSGDLIWYNSMSQYDYGRGIGMDINGNLYIVGTSTVGSDEVSYLLKSNNNGNIQWAKYYGGYVSGSESLWGPAISSDGNSIYYTARKFNTSSGTDIVTIKYNSLGDTQWVKLFNGIPYYNLPAGITIDKYNNIYVIGTVYFPSTAGDFTTIKYLPSGIQEWVATYTGEISNGNDYGTGVLVDSNLNVYVIGNSTNLHGGLDAVTIKYSQPIGIQPISNEIPKSYSLSQNYPNPFNPSTAIKFDITKAGNVSLKIYDINGKEVYSVNEFKSAGQYEFTFDASNYASGLYFYMLESGEFTETKKMILIK